MQKPNALEIHSTVERISCHLENTMCSLTGDCIMIHAPACNARAENVHACSAMNCTVAGFHVIYRRVVADSARTHIDVKAYAVLVLCAGCAIYQRVSLSMKSCLRMVTDLILDFSRLQPAETLNVRHNPRRLHRSAVGGVDVYMCSTPNSDDG